eukprot:TRINITY_DN57862_c0_g1_i1.p1 TRINITY_DN57862_c0_g1~~TRINITY_DN57862_c0_g1_i1.p1  ORF type:complete len:275 (+),score=56.47 TRINITY_DN57862_c0_g1_i1:101-925(+)
MRFPPSRSRVSQVHRVVSHLSAVILVSAFEPLPVDIAALPVGIPPAGGSEQAVGDHVAVFETTAELAPVSFVSDDIRRDSSELVVDSNGGVVRMLKSATLKSVLPSGKKSAKPTMRRSTAAVPTVAQFSSTGSVLLEGAPEALPSVLAEVEAVQAPDGENGVNADGDSKEVIAEKEKEVTFEVLRKEIKFMDALLTEAQYESLLPVSVGTTPEPALEDFQTLRERAILEGVILSVCVFTLAALIKSNLYVKQEFEKEELVDEIGDQVSLETCRL